MKSWRIILHNREVSSIVEWPHHPSDEIEMPQAYGKFGVLTRYYRFTTLPKAEANIYVTAPDEVGALVRFLEWKGRP